MRTERSVRAMAAVLKPRSRKSSIAGCGQALSCLSTVHGIWNTVPMLTLTDLLYKGSLQPEVSKTASIFSAAAERNIAPTLVGFTTFSRTAIRLAFAQICSIDGSCLRRMAQSRPRVKEKPVICFKSSMGAT